MAALFLLLLLVALVLGIVGVAVESLGFLLAVGIVVFAAAVIFSVVRMSRRAGRHPIR